MNRLPNQSISCLAQTEPDRPDGCESVVSEFPDFTLRDRETYVANQIAHRLNVPGIKMMVRLVGIEMTVPSFLFERDKQQQFAVLAEYAFYFFYNFRWIAGMFEHVVANDYINRRFIDIFYIFYKLYAVTSDHRL